MKQEVIALVITAVVITLLCTLVSMAAAQPVFPDPVAEPGAALDSVTEAFKNGGWIGAAGMLMGMLSVVLRPRLVNWSDFFKSTIGGYAMQMGLGLLVAIGEAMLDGEITLKTAAVLFGTVLMSVLTSWGADKRANGVV